MDSLALEKTPPSSSRYGTAELELFNRYTRDTLRKSAGCEAPAFDPTRAPKCWFDSSKANLDPNWPVIYYHWVIGKAGNPVYTPYTIPAGVAATMNLKGTPLYPAYVVAKTSAVMLMGDGTAVQVPANTLSTLKQAQALCDELKIPRTAIKEDSANGMYSFPADEARRIYSINEQNVGLLLATKWSAGVGVKGVWYQVAGQFRWTTLHDDDGANCTADDCPVPERDLKSFEQATVGMLGVIAIARTDVAQPAASGGGLTEAQGGHAGPGG